MLQMWGEAGIVAKLSLVMAVVPMLMGIVYAVRPTEGRLALMRPLSLAGLFSGLSGVLVGLINVARGAAMSMPSVRYDHMMLGLAESLVPLTLAFGCLTIGWLCVALGMTRHN